MGLLERKRNSSSCVPVTESIGRACMWARTATCCKSIVMSSANPLAEGLGGRGSKVRIMGISCPAPPGTDGAGPGDPRNISC